MTVIVLPDQEAVTPAGKPTAAPIPVAPVVVNVTSVIKVLIHNVGSADEAVTVLSVVTVIVPVALIIPQPPVKGIV